MNFHEIGSFQFENLVRNRIPFLLLNLTDGPLQLFPSFHQTHLNQISVQTKANEALKSIREKNLPVEHAIIAVCEDGQTSFGVVSQLMEAGYTNVFFVTGGHQQMKADIPSV